MSESLIGVAYPKVVAGRLGWRLKGHELVNFNGYIVCFKLSCHLTTSTGF